MMGRRGGSIRSAQGRSRAPRPSSSGRGPAGRRRRSSCGRGTRGKRSSERPMRRASTSSWSAPTVVARSAASCWGASLTSSCAMRHARSSWSAPPLPEVERRPGKTLAPRAHDDEVVVPLAGHPGDRRSDLAGRRDDGHVDAALVQERARLGEASRGRSVNRRPSLGPGHREDRHGGVEDAGQLRRRRQGPSPRHGPIVGEQDPMHGHSVRRRARRRTGPSSSPDVPMDRTGPPPPQSRRPPDGGPDGPSHPAASPRRIALNEGGSKRDDMGERR